MNPIAALSSIAAGSLGLALALALASGSVHAQSSSGGASAARPLALVESYGNGAQRAVLLAPPGKGDFARAASALRAGFRAAADRDGGLSVDVYESTDDAGVLAAAYRDFAARGVAVVVGPITRNGVNALASLGQPAVPTLALNQPELPLPPDILLFGLPIEGEMQQLARTAFDDASALPGRGGPEGPRALVVSAPTPLARRAAGAFAMHWHMLGGRTELPTELEPRAVGGLRAELTAAGAGTVVVLGGADLVRAVKAALGTVAAASVTGVRSPTIAALGTPAAAAASGLAGGAKSAAEGAAGAPATSSAPSASSMKPLLYASSMIGSAFDGERRVPELDGVRLMQMPWLVWPEHPAVMGYPRPSGILANAELQRLYALGIDAFRIAREMASRRPAFEIDGVTGRLSFDGSGHRLERSTVPSEVRDGALVARTPAPLLVRAPAPVVAPVQSTAPARPAEAIPSAEPGPVLPDLPTVFDAPR